MLWIRSAWVSTGEGRKGSGEDPERVRSRTRDCGSGGPKGLRSGSRRGAEGCCVVGWALGPEPAALTSGVVGQWPEASQWWWQRREKESEEPLGG